MRRSAVTAAPPREAEGLVNETSRNERNRSETPRPPFQGEKLLHATLKIRTLVKIVVLKELGFDEETVKSLILRNSKINFLRTV
jgi:hypothetical protein